MATVAPEWAVTTWNIHGGERPDLGRLAEVIAAEQPDVVVLQEIRHAQATELAKRLRMRFTWVRKHWPHSPLLWWRAEGMAIMSPHGLDAAGHTEISGTTSSWTWRRRLVIWALVGRADRSVYRVYNVHLSPQDLGPERRAESVRVAEIVAAHGDAPPAIVAGDFNDDIDATVVYPLPGIEHVPPSPTSPADAPAQVLDHVLLPPEATRVSVSVPGGGPSWATLSDHLPVTVRFTIDPVDNADNDDTFA